MLRITGFLFILPLFLMGQQRQKLLFDFNSCSLLEKNQATAAILAKNPSVCKCGLEQDAIELNNQSLTLPTTIDTFFYSDFSLGFSIAIESGSGNLDILSKMTNCNADTSFYIIYQSSDSSFVCTMQQGFDKIVQLVGKADPSKCWQQVFITRTLGFFRLFINGELKDEQSENFVLRLNNNVPIRFNQSPCNFVTRIQALLDQLILANYSMNSSEIKSEIILQDEILTSDTLIFLGASVAIRALSNCPGLVQWTPVSGLSNAMILNPIASPIQQTKYFFRAIHGFCNATDSLLIRVIDTSKIDCSNLKLPTAFTPNQDQLNDKFFISNNYIIDQLNYFDIMDRNGSVMSRFTSPKETGDGTWNGKELMPGTYYYRIAYTCKGQEYKTKGSFFLMK
ncbi:MAG: T9SS type B sorting domain-containing protein [Saprospiraceae bacterium]|nr:T9SS type B sorting domain-containing protein [Saprospiraceae bacterium]